MGKGIEGVSRGILAMCRRVAGVYACAFLEHVGRDSVQGFYFGRPMSTDTFKELLAGAEVRP